MTDIELREALDELGEDSNHEGPTQARMRADLEIEIRLREIGFPGLGT